MEFAPAQPVTGKKRVHVSDNTRAMDVVHQHWQPGSLVAALLLLTAAMANMQLRLPLNRTAQRRSAGRASSPKLKCRRRLPLCNRSNRLSRHQARILRRASIRLSRLVPRSTRSTPPRCAAPASARWSRAPQWAPGCRLHAPDRRAQLVSPIAHATPPPHSPSSDYDYCGDGFIRATPERSLFSRTPSPRSSATALYS